MRATSLPTLSVTHMLPSGPATILLLIPSESSWKTPLTAGVAAALAGISIPTRAKRTATSLVALLPIEGQSNPALGSRARTGDGEQGAAARRKGRRGVADWRGNLRRRFRSRVVSAPRRAAAAISRKQSRRP